MSKHTLIKLSDTLGELCKENNISLVTAESCTGGGLAYALSVNPTSSPILERGYVAYSLQAKQQLLDVLPYTIQVHGAVSKAVAIEMAKGALKNSGAQVSLATTGIAAPDLNDDSKKFGLVWICCFSFNKPPLTFKKSIRGNRAVFIEKAIEESLHALIKYIKSL